MTNRDIGALAALAVLVAGCCDTKYITRTETVEVPVVKIMRVPAGLTKPHPIPDGDLAECPTVAAQRRYELEACNGKLRAIEDRHGENR